MQILMTSLGLMAMVLIVIMFVKVFPIFFGEYLRDEFKDDSND